MYFIWVQLFMLKFPLYGCVFKKWLKWTGEHLKINSCPFNFSQFLVSNFSQGLFRAPCLAVKSFCIRLPVIIQNPFEGHNTFPLCLLTYPSQLWTFLICISTTHYTVHISVMKSFKLDINILYYGFWLYYCIVIICLCICVSVFLPINGQWPMSLNMSATLVFE